MKRFLAFAVAGFVALGGALVPARAADEKVLRRLTFSVNAGFAQTQEAMRTSQLSTGSGDGGSGLAASGGSASVGAREIVRGTVTLDIIGVLPTDDALAVRISESGDKNIAPVRIDLLGDGRIVAAPEDQGKLSAEELEIAGLCARDYLAGRPMTAGSVWDIDSDNGKANFRVQNAADGRVSLVVEKNSKGRAAGGGDQRSTTQLTYDTKRSVPIAATISRRSHVGSLGDLRTMDESFEYRLTSDSFAPAASK